MNIPLTVVVVASIVLSLVYFSGDHNQGVSTNIPGTPAASSSSSMAPNVDPQVLTDTVKQFYSDISTKQYESAWKLLSKNFQDYVQGHDNFVNGYKTTLNTIVKSIKIQDLPSNTVYVEFESSDNVNGQIQTKTFSGSWKLIQENEKWKLDTASITLISTSPTPKPVSQAKTCQFNKEQMRTLLKEYGYTDEEINQFFIMRPGNCFNLKPNNNQAQVYYDDPTSDPSDESSYNSNIPQTTPTPQNTSYNDDSESNKSLKYNPYNSSWEYAGEDESLKYNAFEREWEYAADDERTQYNSFEKEWEYAKDDESLKYNAFEKTWEYAEDDSTTKYNPYESKWEIAAPDSNLKYNYFERTWSYE